MLSCLFPMVANILTTLKCFYIAGLEQEKFGKRRKKSSSSRSRHSSRNSNLGEDCERINGEIIDIHQLENEAFLEGHEISDSFSIEFASSSNKGLTLPKNGFHINVVEDSASNSIIFRHSDSSESKVGVRFLCNDILWVIERFWSTKFISVTDVILKNTQTVAHFLGG